MTAPQSSPCPGCQAQIAVLAADIDRLFDLIYDQGGDLAEALKRTVKLRGWLGDLAEGRGIGETQDSAPPPTAHERAAALGWEEALGRPVPAAADTAPAAGAGSRGLA